MNVEIVKLWIDNMKKNFVTLTQNRKEPASQTDGVLKISDFLHKNIYEYAKDVAEDRALASFRDGLKPSQRRIIKALVDAGAYPTKPTIKSAKIVGDTMGKYHPHGDSGIESALATLVNSQYPLVYGHGNWGSLTDGPASTRYTECRLSDLGMKYIECSEVADMVPNYSGEYLEPIDFPTRVPNFFINSCEGIAVGVSTSIPEHNLGEVIDAFKTVIKKGDRTTTKDILKSIKGPEYSYGGKLLSTEEEVEAVYEAGSGTLTFECDYSLTKQGSKTVLTINEYCPGFFPDKFQDAMIKLIESKDVEYANDSSTKDVPCKFEVIMRNPQVFEAKIHKHLVCKKNYKWYALDRSKSSVADRDVDTRVLEANMLTFMKKWVDYRREIETRVIDIDLEREAEKSYKCRLRLAAVENLDIVKESLEAANPTKFLEEKLDILKAEPRFGDIVGSEFISDLRLSAIRKIDADKIEKEISDIGKEIDRLNAERADIDSVIVKQLNSLKQFASPRKLKVRQ